MFEIGDVVRLWGVNMGDDEECPHMVVTAYHEYDCDPDHVDLFWFCDKGTGQTAYLPVDVLELVPDDD